MTRPPVFLLLILFFLFFVCLFVLGGGREAKWKERGVQTANFIMEGEVWAQDYKMQSLAHLNSHRSLDIF